MTTFDFQSRHRIDGPEGAPALVLANSLGTTLELWDAQVPDLARRFRVLRYDQLGHCRRPRLDGPFSFDELGAEVLSLLDRLEIDRASFCGISMGGMTGLWLGLNAPERIDRLILCCTSARAGSADRWQSRAALVRREGVAAVADDILSRWFTPSFHRRRDSAVSVYRRMLCGIPAEGYAAACEAIRDWDVRDRLGDVAVPTAVIAAELDFATPVADSEAIASGVRAATLEVIPAAAHLANVEQPGAFMHALSNALGA